MPTTKNGYRLYLVKTCFRITLTETNKIYILFTVTTLTTTYSCLVKQNQERSTQPDYATLHVGEYIFIEKLDET